MQAIISKIEAIELKVRKLMHKNDKLAQENKLLLEENIKLKKDIQEKLSIVEKTSSYITDETTAISDQDKVEIIRKELDEYISEIDACMKMLEA